MTTRERGRVRVEDGLKRVRVYLGGKVVADSTKTKLVWEKPYYPTYYFPASDVDTSTLVATADTHRSPSRGEAAIHDVVVGKAHAPGAVRWYRASPIEDIVDHLTFRWDSMDAWFEEEEQVYVHPRDPYTRVDILQSTRHVEVFVGGTKVADSHQPRLLFETGLPVRYYLPKTDVRLDLLEPTDLHTECPYKGTAGYYTVDVDGERHENIVWWYPQPVQESSDIAGYVCFYNERVDIRIDGELETRPKTMFS